MRDPLRIEAECVTIERIVEHVGGVEAGVAEHALRIDRQPAARAMQDVLVVQVAVERPDIARVGQQSICDCGGLDIGAVMTVGAIGCGFLEKAGEPLPERLKLGRKECFDGESSLAITSAAISVAILSPCSSRTLESRVSPENSSSML